jgi:hypothetical protein
MTTSKTRPILLVAALSFFGALSSSAHAVETDHSSPLAGTWNLVAADVKHPDGSEAHDYGASPEGTLMIDRAGRYSLQIFKSERTVFPAADKGKGEASDYRAAVMGSSTHYGTIQVNQSNMTITFHIQDSSFPNWKGETQKRKFTLSGEELSYFGVARPNGDIPISVWRRVE